MAGRSIKPLMIRHTVVIAKRLLRPINEIGQPWFWCSYSGTELYEAAENAASGLKNSCLMSPLGEKQTLRQVHTMSALPPKAGMRR
jgi:hypothetical protein